MKAIIRPDVDFIYICLRYSIVDNSHELKELSYGVVKIREKVMREKLETLSLAKLKEFAKEQEIKGLRFHEKGGAD